MLQSIRKSKLSKIISLQLILCLLLQIIVPSMAYALTSGPGQEEFASFEPASTTDMVDLYTGDFNYNIPLLSVPGPNGGYPINLAYHSGIGMEQEASWVGLGWTLNVGAITRNLRGLPDDFNGDAVTNSQHIKKSVTVSLDIPSGAYKELVGFPDPTDAKGKAPKGGVGYQYQLYYNNYRGMGIRATMDVSGGRPKEGKTSQGSANMNLQISHDSQNGMGIGLNFSAKSEFMKGHASAGFGLGFNYNSRQGLQGFNFSQQAGFNTSRKDRISRPGDAPKYKTSGEYSGSGSSTISFVSVFGVPKVNIQMTSTTVPFSLRLPAADKLFKFQSSRFLNWTGSVFTSKVSNGGIDRVPAIGYMNTNGDPYALKDFNRQEIMYSKKIPYLGASSFTYDLYTQTGQGTGSMFRPYLNTFGVLSDPEKINKDKTTGGGLEFGSGIFRTKEVAGVSVPNPQTPTPPLSIHVGVDLNFGKGDNTSGKWNKIGSKADWSQEFQNLIAWNSSNHGIDYEPYYFQEIGEKTGLHAGDDQLIPFYGDEALRFILDKENSDGGKKNRHFIINNSLSPTGADAPVAQIDGINQTRQLTHHKRIKRNTGIEALSNDQAKTYGFSRNTKIIDSQGNPVGKSFNRPGHHISEISMLQSDGMRYVYGLPLYNNTQIENLFATNQQITDPNFAAVDVISNGNGNVDVSGTYDEFMSKNELPPYAHSWLLTAVFSADYLDVTDDGPTDDDFGYWVKFNYKMVSSSYKWRVPFSKANFIDGFKGNPNDNKGSYTYGTKEICVLESIETKTHKAIFISTPREDGYETGSEFSNNSGSNRGSQRMVKLDKIKLYTKKELLKAANQAGYIAVPSKIVNFEYSYDLCVGIPNNNGKAVDVNSKPLKNSANSSNVNHGGKLTLNKVYFTYQNSTRGMLSPYIFNYGLFSNKQNNPDYDKLQMDKWGNYKNPLIDALNTPIPTYTYPYVDFPYTEQDPKYYAKFGTPTGNELFPAQWTLKEIQLPTGASIKIEFDFDDYAFIEDKQAMRMFDVVGLEPANPSGNACTSVGNYTTHADRTIPIVPSVPTECNINPIDCGLNKVFFNLGQPFSDILSEMGIVPDAYHDANYWFNKLYLENLNEGYIYFDISANLKDSYFDRVKGYAKVIPGSGGLNSGSVSDKIGYVVVENQNLGYPVNVTLRKVSPFTLAAIQHLRANRQELVNDQIPYDASGSAMVQIVNLVGAGLNQLAELNKALVGFNNYAYIKGWGQQIKLNGHSKIRLCQPNYKKIGGGVRVKKIVLDDNWRNNTSNLTEPTSLYGQEYDYTKTVIMEGQEVTISSGVAYEPQIGGEENPLRVPVNYKNSIPLAGVYNLFMEKPIMDNYYPGAGIGYSKVVVRSIAPQQANAENSANELEFSSAPITEYEYFTGKDFPVIFDKTDMNTGRPIRIPIMVPALFSQMKTRQARSQGYSIVLNDMAGKLKSVATKIRIKDPNDPSKFIPGQTISSQKYIYNTENPYNENAINKLNSKVKTLEIDKKTLEVKYISSIVGQSHDMFVDMNEDAHKMESFGLEFNLDILVNVPPAFMIMPIPTINMSESSMRTIVFHKIINRTGILMKVETTTDESTIVTENLAFDIETGAPILTKFTNEFKDPIYNFSYPGHWYYDNMSGAYQNFNLAIDPPGNASILSDYNGYIAFSQIIPFTDILDGRKVSEYFSKGDVVLVKYKLNNNMYTQQYHVFNIDDVYGAMLLIDNNGFLFPVQAEVSSIKVLKSGFKNMQGTSVGSLVFKDIDPAFLSFSAGSSNKALANLNIANGFMDNHVINASAVEYSNDWQVFCGPFEPGKEECICTLTAEAYAFFTMLQSLNTNGLLFSKDVPIYDVVTDSYFNGFSAILLNASDKLLNKKSVGATPAHPNPKFYYTGSLVGNSLSVWINASANSQTSEDCLVQIDLPAGVSWNDVSFISAIKENQNPNGCSPGTGLKITIDSCTPSPCVTLEVVMNNGTKVNASMTVMPICTVPCGCWIFQECYKKITPNYACGIPIGYPINPYWAGMKGMWRPKASYAYNSGRTQTNNVRNDGVFTDFARFTWENPTAKSAKWINATTITKYSPYGFELENKDALGNYSSALYGYDQALVTAIGSNAKYNELAFDNFEDYPLGCTDDHFKYKNYTPDVTPDAAHTGHYSIKIGPSAKAVKDVLMDPECGFVPIDDITDPNTSPWPLPPQPVIAHSVNNCDCLGTFEPMPGKKYVVSAWAKEVAIPTPMAGITNYSAPQLKVTVSAPTNVVYTFAPKGNVIDGWQQIFETFDIPSTATGVKVELVNTSSNRNVFFDDIRLHPNDGNMVSYVYDPITLKIMAELDANNYATVYIYDDEGHLNKVKKETIQGFKTIKEGRINTKKINE